MLLLEYSITIISHNMLKKRCRLGAKHFMLVINLLTGK